MRMVAAVAAAISVALLVPGPASLLRGEGVPALVRRVKPGPGLAAGFAGVAVTLLVTVDGRHLALALILLACAAAVVGQVRRARAARAAEHRQRRVVEVCEALVGELRAGQPPVAALQHCQEIWSALAPVVAAGRLDADVPAALRRLAARPGAEGLREVADAWQVSTRSGAGLAAALAQVAATARERQGTRHLVQGELASAQATARLVALLPMASLAMSAGIGGHPWHFLLATPAGLVCLALGAGCAFAGLFWIDRIAAGVLRG